MTNYLQLFSNPVVWGMLLIALTSYSLILELCISYKNNTWHERAKSWTDCLKILLNCLPLLGLLGTIVGLLQTFKKMSFSSLSQQELLSSGIADALFTTEIGLIMVVPGLLMLSFLNRKIAQYELIHQSENLI